jgi:hypothetical protein
MGYTGSSDFECETRGLLALSAARRAIAERQREVEAARAAADPADSYTS